MAHFNNIRLLLLGAWLGAAVFFGAAVAPNAFKVLREAGVANAGELAGGIVGKTLAAINISGVVAGLIALAIGFVVRKLSNQRRYSFETLLLAVLTVATAAGEFVIAARIRNLRATLSIPIDQVPADTPARVAFQALHGYSVASLSIAIVAGLIAFFVIANTRARAQN